ncbi:GAP family protein [Mycolicibacterium moriokaense]|nr:GAP family protein [Mycolicibacterium moriokaense]
MWGAVLVMALAAMADPLRIGLTVLVISRPRPVLQLLAFWLGGLAMGLLVGLSALFFLRDFALAVMEDMESRTASSAGAFVQIAVGALALLLAVLIAVRVPVRRRARVPDRSPAVATAEPNTLSRLSTRAGDVLKGESLWVAFVVGAWLGTPLQYVAALAAILASGASAGTQIAAVLVYQVVTLAFAEIPLVSQLIAPAKTHAVMLRIHDWVLPRRRQLIAVIVAVVGAFLVVNGINSL